MCGISIAIVELLSTTVQIGIPARTAVSKCRQRDLSMVEVEARVTTRTESQRGMELLQAGVNCAVIALWLSHKSIETTECYLHAPRAQRGIVGRAQTVRARQANRIGALLERG